MSVLIKIDAPRRCCDAAWESAYQGYESAEEEIRKFTRRLHRAGAAAWPRNARIVEVCCGRGNGLEALTRLGFNDLEGVDLSESLLSQYQGSAPCYVCDCRKLPFDAETKDIVILQGGLHHLAVLPDDVAGTVSEAARVLRAGGLLVGIEPWRTPFLDLVHLLCRSRMLRRFWHKLDCVAAMNEHEQTTYRAWLKEPSLVLEVLQERFEPVVRRIAWGKLMFVGRKRAAPSSKAIA